MDRSRRLHEFWNWLPAFRAVAETQHLPTASQQLHVSPSALSRTIRLLEDNLDRPLFTRVGRQIALNPDGENFLAAIRDAMRLVDDGLNSLANQRMTGPVRVYACHPLSRVFITRAMCELRNANPELEPSLREVDETQVRGLLLRGELDVAVLTRIQETSRLEVHKLGEIENSVYAPANHVLSGRTEVTMTQVLAHPFCAPLPESSVSQQENWPPEKRREVAMHVFDVEDCIEGAESSGLLTVVPDILASRLGQSFRLKRLNMGPISSVPVYAVRRQRTSESDKTQEVIAAAQRTLEALIAAA